ncbi:MAG: TQO small subunit DoxD [Prosthecobacter sp.]|nr:TQO small subunit DoxD [Prosthecobacter sp.]
MIEYIGSNPAAQQNPWSSLFKSIAILRIGAGLLLLTRHGWDAAWGAGQFLWSETNWDWVRIFNEAGLPMPTLTAPAVAIVVAAVAFSWCIGFLTRLFAVIFLPIILGFLAFAKAAGGAYTEVGWLYLIITITLILYGSGVLSIDKLFRLGADFGSARKKKRKKGW